MSVLLKRFAVLLAAVFPFSLAFADPSVTSLTLVSEKRITRTVYEYVYKITVKNDAIPRNEVKATLVGVGNGTTTVESLVVVGNLTANQSVTSSDTFTIRHDRMVPFSTSSLAWQFSTVVPGLLLTGNPLDAAVTHVVDVDIESPWVSWRRFGLS